MRCKGGDGRVVIWDVLTSVVNKERAWCSEEDNQVKYPRLVSLPSHFSPGFKHFLSQYTFKPIFVKPMYNFSTLCFSLSTRYDKKTSYLAASTMPLTAGEIALWRSRDPSMTAPV